MKETNMPKILPLSVCMIVRNESHHLPKALASVKGIAAEVVVVDTGSTDDTVSIATAMGAKVLHFDWIDDFAAARGQRARCAFAQTRSAARHDENFACNVHGRFLER